MRYLFALRVARAARSKSCGLALVALSFLAGPLASARADITPTGDVSPADLSTWTSSTDAYIGNTSVGAEWGTYWILPAGQSGTWLQEDSWDNGIPDRVTLAFVTNGGTATITTSNRAYCGNLTLGDSSGSGAIEMSGGTLNTTDTEFVGSESGNGGLFLQSAGTNTTPALSIASTGMYQLNGGVLNITRELSMSGVFDGGGSSSTGLLTGTNCIVDLSHGSLQRVGSLSVNMGANALLIVPPRFEPSTGFGTCSGLVHVAETTLTLLAGQSFGGNGSIDDPVDCRGTITAYTGINLNKGLVLSGDGRVDLHTGRLQVNDITSNIGGGSLSARYEYIGRTGTGLLTHTAGTNSPSVLYLGYNSGDSGTYNLDGTGLLSAVSEENVGYSGMGTFSQCGGTNSGGYLVSVTVGCNSGAKGTYDLSGGLLSIGALVVGGRGEGTFNHSGGTGTIGTLWICTYAGSSGTYNLTDSGHLSAASEYIGMHDQGTFTQSGGTNTTGSLLVGESDGGNGTYNLDGGTLVADSVLLGYDNGSKGTCNLDGGTLVTKSLNRRNGAAAFNFGGGILQASSTLSTNLPTTLTGTGGNANIDTAGYPVTLSGQISGPGGLKKLGTNTLTLSAANTYTGDTAISAGTFILDRPGSLVLDVNNAGSSVMTVATGTELDLFGTIRLDISDVTASSGNWTLISNSGTTIYESSFALVTTDGALFTQASDVWSYGSGLRQWTFTEATGVLSLTTVPEPSTVGLLGIGALGLLAYVWRRRRA
jgi:fibronectin-binding autotransporter adhesin